MTANAMAEDWLIISGKSLGWIELGMKMEKVHESLGVTKDRMGKLYWYKDRGLEFYAPLQEIERILIVKPSFENIHYVTSGGISVGSSCDDVVKAYGPAEHALYSKGVYALNYFEKGITFFIKEGTVCKIVLYRPLGN